MYFFKKNLVFTTTKFYNILMVYRTKRLHVNLRPFFMYTSDISDKRYCWLAYQVATSFLIEENYYESLSFNLNKPKQEIENEIYKCVGCHS